jgi:predicted RNase H-like HicB family nuclease
VQKYAVVIHQDPDGGFWGEVPALPGCYSQGDSSQGDSVDERLENIREATACVLEVLKEEGREHHTRIQILDMAV